jgi:Ca2+:H+ antiporter
MISTARFALHLVTSNLRLGLSLIVVPVAVLLGLLSNVHPAVVFVSNLIAVIPLSILLTTATESLAKDLGPTAGALLNISCGNLAEIIIL